MRTRQDRLMRDMFAAAIASAQPRVCIPNALPDPSEVKGKLVVIGAGKASAVMAQVVEQHWKGPLQGLVVTRYGYGASCQHIEIVEAAHPVPDAKGLQAAQRMLALVQGLSPDDVVLSLISGGGSALLPLPLPGLTLEDKQQLNRALLASGASISEMNTVRRHLSAIKGGRLAKACQPARVITLLISDIPGDHAIDIASGPTLPDPTTCEDALAILKRYRIQLDARVLQVLKSGQGESVKPPQLPIQARDVRMVATPKQGLMAAAELARAQGYHAYILSDAMEGEAREVGKVLAALALQTTTECPPFQTPCVLLSGGETTVTLKGNGRGGRNVECLLSFTLAAREHPRIHALMGDTDGVDGVEEIAGASMGPHTLSLALESGLRPLQCLDANDGHGFFTATGDSIITGPTLTNINDFRVILIDA